MTEVVIECDPLTLLVVGGTVQSRNMRKLKVCAIPLFANKIFRVDDRTLDLELTYSNTIGIVNTDYVYRYVDTVYETWPTLNMNLTIEEIE